MGADVPLLLLTLYLPKGSAPAHASEKAVSLTSYRIIIISPAGVSKVSSKLVAESKQFKWGAKKLNRMDAWKAYAPYIFVALIVTGVGYWRFFL